MRTPVCACIGFAKHFMLSNLENSSTFSGLQKIFEKNKHGTKCCPIFPRHWRS